LIEKDVIIIGGGAAGLFCAIEAGKRGRRVLVLEHAGQVGKKIAISGGGRCNFTNIHTSAANFISTNPHFAKSALARYTPADFVALVERHGIAYHEKKLGQLFCDGSARQIINLLLAECAGAQVEIRCNCGVRRVERRDDKFRVETEGESFAAASLVVATGGLSIPQLGATDFGYQLARQFDLQLEPTRPALVPLTLPAETQARLSELSGVSLDALASCGGASFRENILVTHRGLSGPAILQVSSYWQRGEAIDLNLLPDADAHALLLERADSESDPANVLARYMPRRFALAWCKLYAPAARPLRQLTEREIAALAGKLQSWRITPAGTEGYRKAEVTAGGVSTSELSSRTLEATRVPGLYFVGEVVDVTGHLGGYNFQWAWASGYAAGQFA
jgi:predicted Rossmann fold flavoprotein